MTLFRENSKPATQFIQKNQKQNKNRKQSNIEKYILKTKPQ